MANELGFHTVAEGVESADQADFLEQHGCEQLQGYFFSRPLDADTFSQRWLTA